VQLLTVGHDIAPRSVSSEVFGFTACWIAHAVPFQCSASGWFPWSPVLDAPTAKQALADGHETPVSWLASTPAGFGVV
jgi:hypothetical protein